MDQKIFSYPIWLPSTLLILIVLAAGLFAQHRLADLQSQHHISQHTKTLASNQADLFLLRIAGENPDAETTARASWLELAPLTGNLDAHTQIDLAANIWIGSPAGLYSQLGYQFVAELLPILIIILALFTLLGPHYQSTSRFNKSFNVIFGGIQVLALLWLLTTNQLIGPKISAALSQLFAHHSLAPQQLPALLMFCINTISAYFLYVHCFRFHHWRRFLLGLCGLQAIATLYTLMILTSGPHIGLPASWCELLICLVIASNLVILLALKFGNTEALPISRVINIILPLCIYSLALLSSFIILPFAEAIPLLVACTLLLASLHSVSFEQYHLRLELDERLQCELTEKTASLENSNRELLKIKYDLQVANLELKALSFTDALTSAYNRLYFDRQFLVEWQRARREQEPVSLILVDIDHFKRLNDSHGHLAGDEGLKLVTKLLRQGFQRGNDIVCRYGGEEFVILLPNTNPQQAAIRAQKLCEVIELTPILYKDEALFITASFGVGGLVPQPDHQPLDLLHATDQALYWVKRNGRNGVHISDAFLASKSSSTASPSFEEATF